MKTIKFNFSNSIATIIINRPEKLNALNREILEGIVSAVEEIEKNDDIKVVILTSSGNKAFSAGGDMDELSKETQNSISYRKEASYVIYDISKPVISMIRGYALGGGCELALATDIRIASENAKFGFPEISNGWMPGAGGTQLLPRIIAYANSMELLLTGEFIDAKKAKEIGLVNKVVVDENLETETYSFAEKIAKHSLTSLRYIKEAVKISTQIDIKSGFSFEKKLIGLCFNTKEKDEGIKKFKKR